MITHKSWNFICLPIFEFDHRCMVVKTCYFDNVPHTISRESVLSGDNNLISLPYFNLVRIKFRNNLFIMAEMHHETKVFINE